MGGPKEITGGCIEIKGTGDTLQTPEPASLHVQEFNIVVKWKHDG